MKLNKLDLKSLSVEDLWALHGKVRAVLSDKITAEKRSLEKRLARLNRAAIEKPATARAAPKIPGRRTMRRKYPPVLPKYQNPSDPSETWAGRGKQPRWLERFSVDVNRNSKGVPKGAQIRFGLF